MAKMQKKWKILFQKKTGKKSRNAKKKVAKKGRGCIDYTVQLSDYGGIRNIIKKSNI